MGLNIREIVPKKEIQFSQLNGKIIAVDAFNTIYQFLSSIRQYDGTPLMDSKKRITSHLSGLFYRNINLLSEGLKLIYVFDGKPPELKGKTKEKRQETKDKAKEKYEQAKDIGDVGEMRKYSQQMTQITEQMIQESKELLEALGIAVIQAPSEGESQASHIVKKEQAYSVGSQDYDCLLFGATKLIQNLTLARKRKTVSGYTIVYPELIELEKVLNTLQINHDQLICLGILVGTDYNPKGVPGIGQKKALQVVQKYKQPALIFEQFEDLDFNWQEIFELFKKPNIEQIETIEFPKINPEKIKQLLVKEHEFSEERVDKQIEKLEQIESNKKQKGLQEYF